MQRRSGVIAIRASIAHVVDLVDVIDMTETLSEREQIDLLQAITVQAFAIGQAAEGMQGTLGATKDDDDEE